MSDNISTLVSAELDNALELAEAAYAAGRTPDCTIAAELMQALEVLSENAQRCSAVFTNVATCLAIKAARPDVDIRYHQTQIQKDTSRPAGFNFRGVSEDVIYPWLDRNRFEGAKSGWQTRTLERPKPYTLDYAENIAHVKKEFLTVFHQIEELSQPAIDALTHLMFLQVIRRENVRITLSVPKTQDIGTIEELFRRHFFHKYRASKGASRLPVLAIHAIYSVMIPQLRRYDGMVVKALNEHSAADSQTGSLGDVEVCKTDSDEVFEAVEVKHNLQIDEALLADVQTKVMDKAISRYYILTTHNDCKPDPGAQKIIANIKSVYDCQVIANGVIPSIRYYLRLMDDPSAIFPEYVRLLINEKAIAHEHRTAWNEVVMGIGG